MCKNCGDSNHHPKILKPRKGEVFSINAKNIDDESANTVNNFIRFARAFTKLKDEPNDKNAERFIKARKKLFSKKKSGRKSR